MGLAVGLRDEAEHALTHLRERYWTAVDYVNPYEDVGSVAFLEWMDPLFAGGHWTPQLITAAGGRHGLNPPGAKSVAFRCARLDASAFGGVDTAIWATAALINAHSGDPTDAAANLKSIAVVELP